MALFIGGIPALAQSEDSASTFSFLTRLSSSDTSCVGYYTNLAQKNIEKGHIRLICGGNIIAVDKIPKSGKTEQPEKTIEYEGYGCVVPDNYECLKIYNEIVLKYLDTEYGRKWRRTVRKDVVGLKRIN